MTKPRDDSTEQFSFDLTPADGDPARMSASKSDSRVILQFVDAKTRAVRREAIRRVKASGIFPSPNFRR